METKGSFGIKPVMALVTVVVVAIAIIAFMQTGLDTSTINKTQEHFFNTTSSFWGDTVSDECTPGDTKECSCTYNYCDGEQCKSKNGQSECQEDGTWESCSVSCGSQCEVDEDCLCLEHCDDEWTCKEESCTIGPDTDYTLERDCTPYNDTCENKKCVNSCPT